MAYQSLEPGEQGFLRAACHGGKRKADGDLPQAEPGVLSPYSFNHQRYKGKAHAVHFAFGAQAAGYITAKGIILPALHNGLQLCAVGTGYAAVDRGSGTPPV